MLDSSPLGGQNTHTRKKKKNVNIAKGLSNTPVKET